MAAAESLTTNVPDCSASSTGAQRSEKDAGAAGAEQTRKLQEALARLPEDYRRVLALRYEEERTFEEIGRLLQRSENAARKLWLRAVERLQGEMGETP